MIIFSGEGIPEDPAFVERTVVIYMMKGNPKDNIKRPKDKKWKEEHIGPLRKKLLLWKLQNIGKEFETIDSGLIGRDQELFEDFLSVFAGILSSFHLLPLYVYANCCCLIFHHE